MPLYQTKTIANILEPVAQQVSKLIILHEEGEDGNSMPNLEAPVVAVSKAVSNLVRVGRDTINNSLDTKMKSEMPKSLTVIETAAEALAMASSSLKSDPYSKVGRDRLIEGSRGILQGTTNMLLSFDASQVRKICRDCKKVLDYLAISEVIETMEDLVQFVKDLSPCLSKVSQDVDTRRIDLLNPQQRESLGLHLEQIKTLAPILICSMKIFIQILNQKGTGTDEAIANRNYLAGRMHDEISEVMRILEESAVSDGAGRVMNGIPGLNLTEMTFHEMVKKLHMMLSSSAVDRVAVSQVITHIVELGYKIGDEFDAGVRSNITGACGDLDRANNQLGATLQEQRSRQAMTGAIHTLESVINEAVINRIIQDMADITSPLKQFTDAVLSQEAMERKRELVEQRGHGLKQFSGRLSKTANIVAFANSRSKHRSENLLQLSSQVQNLTPQLVNAGTIKMNYPENKAADENFENLRKQYAAGVQTIRDFCDEAIDIRTFLKQTSDHIQTAIATCEDGVRSKQSQVIVESTTLAARLSNRLLMALARESDNSEDIGLKKQINQSENKLKMVIAPFVESSKTMAINISDQRHHQRWRASSDALVSMVQEVAKLFTDLQLHSPAPANTRVPVIVEPPPHVPPPPTQVSAPVESRAPPRPPLPQEWAAPPRPPLPDTDDEDGLFSADPGSNRPIHMAAHGLYQEVKQWDHTDNEIIAAAKKIAFLMAHLSELIRGGKGTKRELIACAKALTDASDKITDLAKELARHCTDKKIRTNLLQVCEKIPTLGTQLRVMSTVKATMMTNTIDTEEDADAMDMLVFNAQKLNQAVKETVRAAEAASIRVRSDAGFKLRWVRKQPWFHQ